MVARDRMLPRALADLLPVEDQFAVQLVVEVLEVAPQVVVSVPADLAVTEVPFLVDLTDHPRLPLRDDCLSGNTPT